MVMSIEKQNELVLCFKSELMYGFSGLLNNHPKELSIFGVSKQKSDLDWFHHCLRNSLFMPRGIIEESYEYKQIIPYIIMKNGDKYFTYSRDGNEKRLSGSLSVGVGGHINNYDFNNDLSMIVRDSARREFKEEVFMEKSYSNDILTLAALSDQPRAVMYAGGDEMSVNLVHFGVIYVVNVYDDFLESTDLKEEGLKVGWIPREELLLCKNELELWSQLVVEACL